MPVICSLVSTGVSTGSQVGDILPIHDNFSDNKQNLVQINSIETPPQMGKIPDVKEHIVSRKMVVLLDRPPAFHLRHRVKKSARMRGEWS